MLKRKDNNKFDLEEVRVLGSERDSHGLVPSYCEDGNEPLGFIELEGGGEILD
jgi:hypothetical protein